MKKSSETLRGGYQAPECEVISLIYDSAVIMYSGEAQINDWADDEDSIDFNN